MHDCTPSSTRTLVAHPLPSPMLRFVPQQCRCFLATSVAHLITHHLSLTVLHTTTVRKSSITIDGMASFLPATSFINSIIRLLLTHNARIDDAAALSRVVDDDFVVVLPATNCHVFICTIRRHQSTSIYTVQAQ